MSTTTPTKTFHLGHQAELRPQVRRQTRTETFPCLVVSPDPTKRETLQRSAVQSGWKAVVCSDAPNASEASRRTAFKLALIDLEGTGDPADELHRFCESLSQQGNLLLVICGHPENMDEEIWARRLGVWFYLSGLSGGEGLTVVCRDARSVTEKAAVMTTA